jgi:hypothetical protein
LAYRATLLLNRILHDASNWQDVFQADSQANCC